MTEPPPDVRSTLRAIRSRRALVLGLGAVGLTGAVAFTVVRPPEPTATALVLLPITTAPAAGANTAAPTVDTATEVIIATSAPVLTQAARSTGLALGLTALEHRVSASAPSQDVISIKATASPAGQAVTLANAVATSFVHYVSSTGSSSANGAVAGLQAESTQLTQQVQDLQTQINTVAARLATESPNSPQGQSDATLLGSLHSEQTDASLQLSSVTSQIEAARLDGALSLSGTKVLQRAGTAQPVSALYRPVAGLIGLVAGLVLGGLIAVSLNQRRRLTSRDDLARAVGVPVVASVHASPRRSAAQWSSLLESYRPSALDAWNLHRLLRHMGVSESRPGGEDLPAGRARPSLTIHVVSFASDGAATVVGPQLAAFAASTGLRVALVPSRQEALASLRAACATSALGASPRLALMANGDDSDPGVQLKVVVTVAERAKPELPATPSGLCLLAVSAGFATAEDLAGAALAAVEVGSPLRGLVVVNGDAGDRSTGLLSELHGPDGASVAARSGPEGTVLTLNRVRP